MFLVKYFFKKLQCLSGRPDSSHKKKLACGILSQSALGLESRLDASRPPLPGSGWPNTGLLAGPSGNPSKICEPLGFLQIGGLPVQKCPSILPLVSELCKTFITMQRELWYDVWILGAASLHGEGPGRQLAQALHYICFTIKKITSQL